MSSPIVEVDAFTAQVIVPDPGELVTAASLKTAIQPLTNRAKHLKDHGYWLGPNGGGGNDTLTIPLGGALDTDPAGQAWQHSYGLLTWIQTVNVALAASPLMFAMPVPFVGKLKEVHVRWNGKATGAGHAGLPANMPGFVVLAGNNGTVTTVGGITDPSPNVGAYDSPHATLLTGLNYAFTSADHLVLAFVGEYGANSVANSLGIYTAEMVIGL